MKQPESADVARPSAWKTAPRWSVVVFLLAIFFIFASFGFVFDIMDLGRQPSTRFALSVISVGFFCTLYAATGIVFRKRFWIPAIPIFILHNVWMNVLYRWQPDGPAYTHLDAAQLSHLQKRLLFDCAAVILSVILGYIGFLLVSISEARRRTQFQLDNAALETELAAAREIQRLMVPEKLPPAPGYSIESIYQPAAQVGGDFFQVIPLEGGQTLVVVGDVSGKGISAAMIVSMLLGMLDAISKISYEPARILAELNSTLFERMHGGFVTCVIARLNPSGHVALANAGHLPPWLNGDEITVAGSLPLGLMAPITPELVTFEMSDGDRLTLITDGVVEARDASGALFGFDRTQSLMRQQTSPGALANAAMHHGQEDDLTVISILRTAL